MARRYGAGAVMLRSDGRWEGQLRLPDGGRQYVYGADRRQVISRLREERWRIASGIPRKANGPVFGRLATITWRQTSPDAIAVVLR